MPLNIRVPNPNFYAGALLEHEPPISDVFAAFPGFKGAWDAASGWTPGANTVWDPAYGGGSLSQGTAGRAPEAGTRDGMPIIAFQDDRSAFLNFSSIPEAAAATALTFGARLYLRSNFPTRSRSLILDGNNTGPIFEAANNNDWYYELKADRAAVPALPLATVGWHTVMLHQSGAAPAAITVDGVTVEVTKAQSMSMAALILGARTSASTSAKMDMRRLFLAFGVSGDAAVRGRITRWLAA